MLQSLTTEARNPQTRGIDLADAHEILALIHAQDRQALEAVSGTLSRLVPIVERVASALSSGGRLIYAGAGTSGRLGVLDAAECPPTFGTDPQLVRGILAGGTETLVRSREGVEDRPEDGAADVDALELGEKDVLVGISASRRTPYVRGALSRARQRQAWTAFLVCNELGEDPAAVADHVVEVITGPEAITGSTRMKAALAQKMMLTMISTASMVRVGKVYENLMVDVAPTSAKLVERARGLVMAVAGVDYDEAARLLAHTQDRVKPAIVMAVRGVGLSQAESMLEQAGGFLRRALET